jgi:hypothetical protein
MDSSTRIDAALWAQEEAEDKRLMEESCLNQAKEGAVQLHSGN